MSLGLLLLMRIARRAAPDDAPLTYGDLRAVLRTSGLTLDPDGAAPQCQAEVARGGQCQRAAPRGKRFCWAHDPEKAEEHRRQRQNIRLAWEEIRADRATQVRAELADITKRAPR